MAATVMYGLLTLNKQFDGLFLGAISVLVCSFFGLFIFDIIIDPRHYIVFRL